MNATTIALHQYLYYSQHQQPTDPSLYCALVWDLRENPASSARHVSKLDTPMSTSLSHPATFPPVTCLTITCDIFPETWSIQAHSPVAVTLLEVLQAVYTSLHVPLEASEFERLSSKQRDRIQKAFERRCALAITPAQCEADGKLRIDFLGRHTLFGGLSVSLENANSCILSLRRPHS